MNKKFLILSVLVMLSLILAACGGGAAPAGTEAPASTESEAVTEAPASGPVVLNVASGASITTFDPIASFSTEVAYLANSYEQLLRVNPPGSAEPYTPMLAESWDVSEDGMVYTFHIRPGVKFHDGEPLNAEAVKKSIEASIDHGAAGFVWLPVEKIEVVDEMTVKMTLLRSIALELVAGSEYGAFIVSPKALDAAAADENFWADGKSYGTGPYMVESYTPDAEIVFTQNTEYWGGWEAGQAEKVVASLVPEATTRQQLLEGGEADIATGLPPENIDSFSSNPDYTVVIEPSTYNYLGFFNTKHPPLDNIKVRQALSYAIPYEDIIKTAVLGRGTQSYGPVPAGVFPFDDKLFQYSYDLEKAKALLKEAGYENGGFSLNLTYTASNSTEESFVPLIKDSFAQIGVDLTITPMAWGQQYALGTTDPEAKETQDMFIVLYWPTFPDAGVDNLRSMFRGVEEAPYINGAGFNFSYWFNADFNALVDEARLLTGKDRAASQAKYSEAMSLLIDEAPGVYFFDAKAVYVVPNHVQGFKYNLNYPGTGYFYYDLRLTK
jgi:peptide/nickel transport system substrate-binding protein